MSVSPYAPAETESPGRRNTRLELVYALPIAVGVIEGAAGQLEGDTVEGKVMLAARESLSRDITCANGTLALGGSGLRKPNARTMAVRSWDRGGRSMYQAEVQDATGAQAGAGSSTAPAATDSPHGWDPTAGDRCTRADAAGGGSKRNVNACVWGGPTGICYILLWKRAMGGSGEHPN